MQLQPQFMEHPTETNKALYAKYSSSQTYYYSNVIAQIVKQRRTVSNINFQDIEYISDLEEYLKRYYMEHEHTTKMSTFKQYYFYHEDCPRIFMKHIEQIYSKWQDRKRDLVYKKLKILYNESLSSDANSSRQDTNKSATGLSHFLLEISDYNPFSKKYYLRQQPPKQKLNQQEKSNSQNQFSRTINDLSSLNHNLSVMLNDISQLSSISTLQQQESPRFSSLYHSKKLKVNYSSENSTYHNSQSNSNLQNSIKFNFKKNKFSPTKDKSNQKEKSNQKDKSKSILRENSSVGKARLSQQLNMKIQAGKQLSHEKSNLNLPEQYAQYPQKMSPKFEKNKLSTNMFKQNPTKSKSIIQLSSFNPSRKSQILLNLNNNKKELLKLQSDKKTPSKSNRIILQNKAVRVYDSQKKPIKSQSQKKMPQMILEHERVTYQSIGKRTSGLAGPSSSTVLRQIERKNSYRQPINIINQKTSQFSDNKLQKNQQLRFRSHKSQYLSLPKTNLLTRVNSPTKITLKVSQDKKNPNREKPIIHITKKSHQLKIQ